MFDVLLGLCCLIVLFDCVEERVDDVDFGEQTRDFLYLSVSTYNQIHQALGYVNMAASSVVQDNDLPLASI